MYRPRSRPAPPKMALSIAQLFVVVILAVFCEVDAFSIPIAFSRQKATTLRQSVLSNISPMYYKQRASSFLPVTAILAIASKILNQTWQLGNLPVRSHSIIVGNIKTKLL